MGAVPAARRAGRAVSVGSARRRQGRAARRTRAAELGRAALGRYPRAEGLIMASLKLPTSSRRLEPYRTGAPSPFPAAAAVPGAIVFSGAGTDHLPPGPHVGIDDVIGAYEEQCAAIEKLGGRIVLMASRALAAAARTPEDYAKVYARVLSQLRQPVIIHWLGDMFDPALAGYWGHEDLKSAMDVCLAVLADNAEKIDGVKISLLSDEHEIAMRRRLPRGMRMYTGDDFHFAELIAGDEHGHSDALLGIFDAIAPAASAALTALARGDRTAYEKILAPTVPLSRHIFAAPTRFYKTGVVFMAWLNGHQDHFVMVGGQHSARHILHLSELFRLADRAELLRDPDLATRRMRTLLATNGIEA